MSQVVGQFIQIYKACQNNEIPDFKEPKDVKLFIEKMLNNLSTDLKLDKYNYQNNILIITHFLLSENDNQILENIKKEILVKIVNGQKINAFTYASKIKFLIKEEIYSIRNNIINIIKEHNENIKLEGDLINEVTFYDALRKEKKFIKLFIEEYRITKLKYEEKYFKIIEDFQSFNLERLKKLFIYLKDFNILYRTYKLFMPIFKCIKNIYKYNINNNNYYLIFTLMEKNLFFINSRFDELELKLDEMRKEINDLKRKNERLEVKNERLEVKVNSLDADLKKIKKNYCGLSKFLECPIKQEIMDDPVITPYGTTYENSLVREWIRSNHSDPISRRNLYSYQLIKNIALKNVIDEYKKHK